MEQDYKQVEENLHVRRDIITEGSGKVEGTDDNQKDKDIAHDNDKKQDDQQNYWDSAKPAKEETKVLKILDGRTNQEVENVWTKVIIRQNTYFVLSHF